MSSRSSKTRKVPDGHCQRCRGTRVAYLSGKVNDTCTFRMGKYAYSGNPTNSEGITQYNDEVHITYCLDCGQIQGKFPLPKTKEERLWKRAGDEYVSEYVPRFPRVPVVCEEETDSDLSYEDDGQNEEDVADHSPVQITPPIAQTGSSRGYNTDVIEEEP